MAVRSKRLISPIQVLSPSERKKYVFLRATKLDRIKKSAKLVAPLIKKRVADIMTGRTKVLKNGNLKLHNSIAIWNIIEVLTCPHASLGCLQFCYAQKASFGYGGRSANVFTYRYACFLVSQRRDFVEFMIRKIRGKKKMIFRIHESGDFYNEEYFRKWLRIAREFPDRVFTAYTKSLFTLKYKLPPNFNLIYSFDRTNVKLAPIVIPKIKSIGDQAGISYVYIDAKDREIINKLAVMIGRKPKWCPATPHALDKSGNKICGRTCLYCYNPRIKRKFVVFRAH